METTQERLVRYLDEAWAVEKALVSDLREMADEVNDQQVRALFEEHAQVTHQQEENLEARIRALGQEPSGAKGFVHQMIAKAGDLLQGTQDEYDKTTQDLMKGFATENLEMAMYQSLESFATAIGDQETAQLARRHFDQEKEAANRVWPMIEPAAARPAQLAGTSSST
jgi:ferritin-like metal-binding protein YciE